MISARHNVNLYCLTNTPNPMKLKSDLCKMSNSYRPFLILGVRQADNNEEFPSASTIRQPTKKVLMKFMTNTAIRFSFKSM